MTESQTCFKSGFVSIIGLPNVGKSTLLNKLIGQKIAIVSQKAQTTRNRITGVLTKENSQTVFLDTPGITTPKNKLGEYMLKVSNDAMSEVEAILMVFDARNGVRDRDKELIERVKNAKAPVIAVLNKIDTASLGDIDACLETLEGAQFFAHICKISALDGQGVKELIELLEAYLVEGPQYFPADMVTDQPERLICGELVRESALNFLREEVPHGIGVEVDRMTVRDDDMTDVYATIYCERDSHKGMLIGKGGTMLRKIGEGARREMEWMLGTRVNLQLYIKVRENWRNSPLAMRELGYE